MSRRYDIINDIITLWWQYQIAKSLIHKCVSVLCVCAVAGEGPPNLPSQHGRKMGEDFRDGWLSLQDRVCRQMQGIYSLLLLKVSWKGKGAHLFSLSAVTVCFCRSWWLESKQRNSHPDRNHSSQLNSQSSAI